MRSSKLSRSSKHLNLELPHRKLKLSRSSHEFHSPVPLVSTRKDQPVVPTKSSADRIPHEPVIIQVEDQMLLHTFSCYPISTKHQYFRQGMNAQGKDFIVLSKIDEFAEQYNRYAENVYSHCKSTKWIVISNAFNNEAVQEEFNSLYEPIKFIFLRSIAAAVNHINFLSSDPDREVRLSFFSKIVNFQAYWNDYACILQESRQKMGQIRPQMNSLWLICQEDLPILKKTGKKYYLLDQHCLLQQSLKIMSYTEELVYVITQSHQEILSSIGIDQLESQGNMSAIKEHLARGPNSRYCQKVIEKYLSQEIVYGLVGFPPQITRQLCKHLLYIVVVPKRLNLNHTSFYYIYYQSRDQSDILSFCYDKEDKVVNQAYRIKNYYEALTKIANSYRHLWKQTQHYLILFYRIQNEQLIREISLFTHSAVRQLHTLDDLNSIPEKKTLLIARFTKAEKQLLAPSLLEHFIDYDKCDQNSLIVHNQVLMELQNLKKSEEGWEELQQSPKVISFNVQLPEFSSQPIYLNKEVSQFKDTLAKIEENYHHLIVMAIEDYNEQHQKIIQETERIQNVTFEVYLKYGSEFILRSKREKYQFLKRDQLIATINQIIRLNHRSCYISKKTPASLQALEHEDYHQKIYSTMLLDNYFEPNYLSTPNLQESHQKELFILIPKTVPHHSLLNRSAQEYTLLVYGSMEQAHYFSRHLYRHMYAAAIVGESDRIRHLQNLPLLNFSCIKVKHLGQKEVRDEIDKIVVNFGLTKKLGSISKAKVNTCNLVLYDNSDSRQIKLISSINNIFKNSKVITIPKDQFRQLKHRYNLVQNVTIYELGTPEHTSSKRIRNVVDLLKVFMSPYQASIQFFPDQLAFNRRQFFVREYLERSKKAKIKGRLRDLSLSRCTSPRSKSLVAKECINQAGIVIIESNNFNSRGKRLKFSSKNELIRVIYEALNKGNHLIVILTEEEYQDYYHLIQKRPPGIFWTLVTQSMHKCIVNESHLVYCVLQQIPIILSAIVARFKALKQAEFARGHEQANPSLQKEVLFVTVYENWSDFIEYLLPTDEPINIVKDMTKQYIELQELNGALVFRKGKKLQSVLSFFGGQSIEKKRGNQENQMIIILTRVHNRQFIERCLLILQEKSCLIVTYRQLQNILFYVQICNTLLVVEEFDCIFNSNFLRLNPSDTPTSFSPKLGGFINSLRKDV